MKNILTAILVSLIFATQSHAQSAAVTRPLQGGTGIANANTKTITLGGPLVTTGAFTTTFAATGTTGVTLPTSGTLATTAQITGGTLAGSFTTGAFAGDMTQTTGILLNNGQGFGTGAQRWIGTDGTTANWFYNVPTAGVHHFAINNVNALDVASAAVTVTGTLTVSAGGSTNKAICWKTGTVLGYCSTIVGADGSCTCN